MCTVTFLPVANGIIVTSNRDEKTARPPALLPELYNFKSGKILYPKDALAGGTWIAQHSNGNIMVLLNGAFVKHQSAPPYKKSRGLIFLEIFDANDPISVFSVIDLDDIEPFTLVIWQLGNLWEARWDGIGKYCIACPNTMPHMWQSVTLYDNDVRVKREQWFANWIDRSQRKDANEIMQFHEFGGDGDATNDLKMNRDGKLKTVSITCIEHINNTATLLYKDIAAGITSVHEWHFSNMKEQDEKSYATSYIH